MSAVILLAASLLLGIAMARNPRLPPQATAGINFWVIEVALPSLVLSSVPKLVIDPHLLLPVAAPWFVFFGALLVFPLLGRLFGWTRGSVGALVLTCGLGNTAFMGIALIEALRGPESQGTAVLADQLGSFLMLSLGGVTVAAAYAGERAHPRELAKRLFNFAPFLALLLALALRLAGLQLPTEIDQVLVRLGQTLTPLALFSIGLQWKLGGGAGDLGRLAAGLGWKMLVAPLVVLIAARLAGAKGLVVDVAVLQAAMGPMVTAGIIAERHGLDPPLASRMVAYGSVLALLTVPGWALLLG